MSIDEKEQVASFEEKRDASGAGWLNAGVYLLAEALLESIPPGRPVSIEREMFPKWTGRAFYGFRCDGALLDIGTPERYARAEAFFAAQPGRPEADTHDH